jgi:hypothetical protein
MVSWTDDEKELLKSLDTPWKIQCYLDSLSYNASDECKSPRYVIKNKKAHCSEGALFASACLQFHGYKPILMDLRADKNLDDDHILAIFNEEKYSGAIAKSNYSGLTFREAIYKNNRELALSYFEDYFNSKGQKTLREYSPFLTLTIFDNRNWQTTDEDLNYIGEYLDELPHKKILFNKIKLSPVGKKQLEAGLIGSNPEGLFKLKDYSPQ